MNTQVKNALWLLMEFDINRYLMRNAHGRWDGSEKATRHRNLTNIFLAVHKSINTIDLTGGCYVGYIEDYDAVHDGTQVLTNNMDTMIGFPLEVTPDYNVLVPLFFEKFVTLAETSLDKQVENIYTKIERLDINSKYGKYGLKNETP